MGLSARNLPALATQHGDRGGVLNKAATPVGRSEYAKAVAIEEPGSHAVLELIAYQADTNEGPEKVQGGQGPDANARPMNHGSLVLKSDGPPMTYTIFGPKDTYKIYLTYLELTTVADSADGSTRAYVVKAIAANNIVESTTKGPLAYELELPDDNGLDVVNGEIKIGNSYVVPNYGLTGTVSGELGSNTGNSGDATGPASGPQSRKGEEGVLSRPVALGIGGTVVLCIIAGTFAIRRKGKVSHNEQAGGPPKVGD